MLLVVSILALGALASGHHSALPLLLGMGVGFGFLYSRWKRRQSSPTPTSILGSACKLDLRRGVGLGYQTGSSVNAWADNSGTGNNAATASAGTFPTDTAGAAGLDFNGTTNLIDVASHSSLNFTTAMVLGFKCTPDVATGNHCPITKAPTTGGSWSLQSNAAGLRIHFGTAGTNFGEGASVLSAGVSTYFLLIFDGSGGTNATKIVMRKDGSPVTLSFTGTIPSSIAVSTDPIRLGAFAGGSQYWDGKIACVFAANVVPSAGEITALEAYLAAA